MKFKEELLNWQVPGAHTNIRIIAVNMFLKRTITYKCPRQLVPLPNGQVVQSFVDKLLGRPNVQRKSLLCQSQIILSHVHYPGLRGGRHRRMEVCYWWWWRRRAMSQTNICNGILSF